MIHDKSVPGRFWAEAMKTAAYVINRIPQQNLNYVSPYEKLKNVKPNVSHLRVFGCVCYVVIPSSRHSKMEKKAVRCIFVGYDQEKKGWKCCDPTSGKCYVSKNVVFDETSSWWSPDYKAPPDSQNLTENLENSRVRLNLNNDEVGTDEDIQDNPSAETNGNNDNETGVWRSTRLRKPNPRYANAAIIQEDVLEPESYDQASIK
ncbi:hypothetical protein LXL04_031766 [Taraxacum kok-saghyz]